jgi:hypothetical protein
VGVTKASITVPLSNPNGLNYIFRALGQATPIGKNRVYLGKEGPELR